VNWYLSLVEEDLFHMCEMRWKKRTHILAFKHWLTTWRML